tara:strand:+ start:2053 stop:2883 length:831 start_codon:yes stop_codon:yes gene_type:complete
MWSRGDVALPLRESLEKRGHRVWSPTLPGHHRTTSVDVAQLSLRDYADAIGGLIDSNTFAQPPVIVGHSMGGLIAQMVAAERETGPVVLLNSAGPAGVNHILPPAVLTNAQTLIKPAFWRRSHILSWQAARYGLLNEVDLPKAREIYENLTPESGTALGELVFWFLDPNRTSTIRTKNLRAPILIVSGGRDRITSAPIARALAKCYPQAESQIYPHHGHWIFEEAGRDTTFSRIADWIERTGSPTTQAHHGILRMVSPSAEAQRLSIPEKTGQRIF